MIGAPSPRRLTCANEIEGGGAVAWSHDPVNKEQSSTLRLTTETKRIKQCIIQQNLFNYELKMNNSIIDIRGLTPVKSPIYEIQIIEREREE